ncbi:MAG: gamma-glutamylcyclotransferase [Betaproteobacteria bacterium]|nr:gamma-glutamylcyclotransferase [Betaproteobacteria bacterium]
MSAAVFTYGSLTFEPVWQAVVRGACHSVPARVRGYRRHALRDATYPAMVAADGGEVLGRLWLAVPDDDLVRLDRFEGAEYRRVTVPAHALAGGPPVAAQAYLWLDPARLLPHDWDIAAFERDHLRDFARVHGAAGGRD